MTWQDAARGIPVWVGAAVRERDNTASGVVIRIRGDRLDVFVNNDHMEMGDDAWYASDCSLDLSDPDTRAAFDRRLAIALGAPENVVNEGVRFFYTEGAWCLACGPRNYPSGESNDPFFYRLSSEHQTDPLLARALAWPANKR